MPRSKYPVKFKLALVQDVLSGQGRIQVARKYDVPVETLKDWLDAFRSGRLGGEATGAIELARLRLENLQHHGFEISMSRKACPTDNPAMESFFATLEKEEIAGAEYATFEEVHQRIGHFIEKIYNPIRLHSSLDYRSPIMFESQQNQTQALSPYPPTTVQNEGRIPQAGGDCPGYFIDRGCRRGQDHDAGESCPEMARFREGCARNYRASRHGTGACRRL